MGKVVATRDSEEFELVKALEHKIWLLEGVWVGDRGRLIRAAHKALVKALHAIPIDKRLLRW